MHLGGYRFEMHLHTRAWDGETLETERAETATLEVDAKGQYRLVHNIGEDKGKEVTWVGGRFYTRHRYGTFLNRDDGARQAPRLRDEVWQTFAAQLDVLAPGIDVIESNGHVVIRKAAQPARPVSQSAAAKKWRETVVVESAEGQVTEEAGLPIAVTLRAAYAFHKEGHRPKIAIEYRHTVERASPIIAPPEEYLPTPVTRTLEPERRRLLEETP